MTKTLELSDFMVTGDLPDNVVQSPTFLTGRFRQAVYDRYQEQRSSTYKNNSNLRLQLKSGSNIFDSILINQLIREAKGNPRTALPADLGNPKVLQMVEGKHYVDSQALVLRSTKDSNYSRNEPLAGVLAEHVDATRLEREPALMHGFTLKLWPEDKKGYGLIVVPSDEFSVHYDDRLLEKWNGYKFDDVDEIGLPKNLDKTKGSRIWYTRKDGLSGLSLLRDLYLSSNWNYLDYSGSDGRVVVVSGEATGADSKNSK